MPSNTRTDTKVETLREFVERVARICNGVTGSTSCRLKWPVCWPEGPDGECKWCWACQARAVLEADQSTLNEADSRVLLDSLQGGADAAEMYSRTERAERVVAAFRAPKLGNLKAGECTVYVESVSVYVGDFAPCHRCGVCKWKHVIVSENEKEKK